MLSPQTCPDKVISNSAVWKLLMEEWTTHTIQMDFKEQEVASHTAEGP